jgi:predicted O-methyltransferase YrrM
MARPLEAVYRKYATHARALHRSDASAHDALALQELAPLGGEALPWTEFSMRPAVIAAIVSDIIIHERRSIFECGSGNSTVFVARLLARVGTGHIVSFEHDERWAALTGRLLAREGLEGVATVVRAPLSDGWYGLRPLEAGSVDLLIVDGPPSRVEASGQDRYPALPFFYDSLAPGATILLDDAQRPGEQAVLARWENDYGLTFTSRRGSFASATNDRPRRAARPRFAPPRPSPREGAYT